MRWSHNPKSYQLRLLTFSHDRPLRFKTCNTWSYWCSVCICYNRLFWDKDVWGILTHLIKFCPWQQISAHGTLLNPFLLSYLPSKLKNLVFFLAHRPCPFCFMPFFIFFIPLEFIAYKSPHVEIITILQGPIQIFTDVSFPSFKSQKTLLCFLFHLTLFFGRDAIKQRLYLDYSWL